MKYILPIYRFLLILGILGLFGWLVYKNAVVSGELILAKDFCEDSQFISNLYPENRAGGVEEENRRCFQRFFIEPIYFKVKIPRTFAKAKVKIFYQNPDSPVFQLGLMKRKIEPLDWNFELKPIENKIFENLDWFKLSEEGITLWQKEKRFNTIHEYVNNVPIDQKSATFYYQFSPEAVKNPTKVVVWNQKTPLEQVDYIIADYQSPEILPDDWQAKTVEFLAGLDWMNDHYLEFIVSAPGLTEARQEIKISRIEVELIRPPTTLGQFFTDFKNFLLKKLEKFENF